MGSSVSQSPDYPVLIMKELMDIKLDGEQSSGIIYMITIFRASINGATNGC